jgi:hypothetical protein
LRWSLFLISIGGSNLTETKPASNKIKIKKFSRPASVRQFLNLNQG